MSFNALDGHFKLSFMKLDAVVKEEIDYIHSILLLDKMMCYKHSERCSVCKDESQNAS